MINNLAISHEVCVTHICGIAVISYYFNYYTEVYLRYLRYLREIQNCSYITNLLFRLSLITARAGAE